MAKTALEETRDILSDLILGVVPALSDISDGIDEIYEHMDDMGSYVDEWLDDHPEATTTVEDGAVTTAKLASGAVTTGKLADGAVTDAKLAATGVKADVARLRGNILRGSASGATVTLADAYAVPPLSVTVDGKSVQDGTPTPSDPVEIESVESVAVVTTGKNVLLGTDASASDHSVTRSFTASTGVLSMSGTADANNTDLSIVLAENIHVPEGANLTVSIVGGTRSKSAKLFVYGRNTSNTYVQYKEMTDWSVTFDGLGGETIAQILIRSNSGNVLSINSRLMVSFGTDVPTEYQPYSAPTTTPIDLDGHVLRSLPDGTHDELLVDEDGHVTLVQRVGYVADAGSIVYTTGGSGEGTFALCQVTQSLNNAVKANLRSTHYEARATAAYGHCYFVNSDVNVVFVNSGFTSKDAAIELLTDVEFIYPLATPQTHDLGTITLPTLPAPDVTAWADTDPDTTMGLGYERDQTIAYDQLMQAIADV